MNVMAPTWQIRLEAPRDAERVEALNAESFGPGRFAKSAYRLREGVPAGRATRKLFAFSILYLFALFAVLLVEVACRAIAPLVW